MHLIVPLGGLSRRFGLPKPKWLLTHPDGRYMIEHSVGSAWDCLPYAGESCIWLVTTQEVLHEFELWPGIFNKIFGGYANGKIKAVVLEGASGSQLETVARAITQERIKGPAMIKDCDNSMTIQPYGLNFVSTHKIGPSDDIRRLQMKSFASHDGAWITRLVEKQVISDTICTGSYGFEHVEMLTDTYRRLAETESYYMSAAVNDLISQGVRFEIAPSQDYRDWGTLQEWVDDLATYRNVFIDIDGVVFENGSRVIAPQWGDQAPIEANVEALRRLSTERVKMYFLTARPESYRDVTSRQLDDLGLRYESLIMGLFHARRTLVNDFSASPGSQWPTAEAINVVRNSSDLAAIIKCWPGNNF